MNNLNANILCASFVQGYEASLLLVIKHCKGLPHINVIALLRSWGSKIPCAMVVVLAQM